MAKGDESSRFTPALVFCFNRDICWDVAEQLKGKKLMLEGQQAQLTEELKKHNWSQARAPSCGRFFSEVWAYTMPVFCRRYKRHR